MNFNAYKAKIKAALGPMFGRPAAGIICIEGTGRRARHAVSVSASTDGGSESYSGWTATCRLTKTVVLSAWHRTKKKHGTTGGDSMDLP
jgi:hypothetical protein